MELCDAYLNELLSIDPTLNDFLSTDSYKKHIQPIIYSEPYYDKIYQLNNKYLKYLKQKKDKSRYETILLNDILHSIHLEEEYEIYMYMPVNSYENRLIDYISECSGNGYYQFKKPSDYQDFMKRMKSLTPITNEIIKKMRHGIKKKRTLYIKIVDQMIQQIESSLKEKSYYQTKVSYRKKWDKCVNTYLVSNLQRFLFFLINEYYPHCSKTCGLHSYKEGKKYYRKLIHYEICKDCSPELIHEFGKRELQKIKQELKKLSIKPTPSPYTNEQEIIKELYKIQTKVKQLNHHLFDKQIKDYKVKSVPKERQNTIAYYEKSTPKKKQGIFYINTNDISKWNPYELLVLSLHEGFPGHHYELEYHKDQKKPKYMELWMNQCYSEGWAFYSENLYPYKKDQYYYYKLQYDLLRTLRLIIDTGLHYYGWTYEKCFEFMKQNSEMKTDIIHKELIRYLCLPAQAVSYKIGGTILLHLRQTCLKQGYSLKEFHKLVLSLGPCPMDDLINYVYQLTNQ